MRSDRSPRKMQWLPAMALIVLCSILGTPPAMADDPNDFQLRTLLINHKDVVTDANRTTNPCSDSVPVLQAWSFGRLMKEIAAVKDDDTAAEFIKSWLSKFKTTQQVNGEEVVARNIDKIWN